MKCTTRCLTSRFSRSVAYGTSPGLFQYLDATYLKNRAMYLLAANPPLDDAGGSECAGVDLRPKPEVWNIAELPDGEAFESEGCNFVTCNL